MDRYPVSKIMQTEVVAVNELALVDDIRDLMDSSVSHSAFPVVSESAQGEVLVGIILKDSLREILRHTDLFHSPVSVPPRGRIPYGRIQASEFSEKHSSILRGKADDNYSG
jgi:Mg2+/Co2+ transporter CorC